MAFSPEQLKQLGGYEQSMTDQMNKSNTAYNATINSINQQNTNALNTKTQSEADALKSLQGNNATAYAQYKRAINPYGKTQSQGNYGSNVSNYLANSAYGTMLGGIGTNQANYQTALNNSNTIWNNWLASKAGLIADAENTKQTSDDNWYQYYMGLKQKDDELALQKAQQEEAKRQFEQEMAYKYYAANLSNSSSGSSGSYTYEPTDADPNPATPTYTPIIHGTSFFTSGTANKSVNGDKGSVARQGVDTKNNKVSKTYSQMKNRLKNGIK